MSIEQLLAVQFMNTSEPLLVLPKRKMHTGAVAESATVASARVTDCMTYHSPVVSKLA